MTEVTPAVPAGWFVDPQGSNQLRWWDGSAWTSHYTPQVAVDAPVQQSVPVAAGELPARQAQDASGQFESGQSDWARPAYGQSAGGHGAIEQSRFGQSTSGQSTFGQSTSEYSPFGQSSFGQPAGEYSPFGQSTAGQSAYGQPSYGYAPQPVLAAPSLNFGESIATVFRKYADFTGVASRSEYWWWYLFSRVVTVLIYVPLFSNDMAVAFPAAIVMFVWLLGIFVPALAVIVRRLRDTGRSWLLVFLNLVPVGSIILLVLLCQPSAGYRGGGAGRR